MHEFIYDDSGYQDTVGAATVSSTGYVLALLLAAGSGSSSVAGVSGSSSL